MGLLSWEETGLGGRWLRGVAACALERGFQVVRQRRMGFDTRFREGMVERQPTGMEELTLQPEVAAHAVDGISRYGQLDRGQMNADLVRSPRLQAHPQERVAVE